GLRQGRDHPLRPPDGAPERRGAACASQEEGRAALAGRRSRPGRHSRPGRRRGQGRSHAGNAAGRRLRLRPSHRLPLPRGPDHRAGAARGGVPRVLRRRRRQRRAARMNLRLYLQTLRWNRVRLAAVVVAAVGWGILIPIIYVQFAQAFKDLADSGVFPKELMNFGSGSLFTLPGALTLGLQHPLAIAFVGIFAIGSTVSAVAGERESGTLEVLLSRPISRQSLYVTLAVAVATL